MPSITWWNRLEPRPRAPRIAETLTAPIRDACWMLTRQWMLGEFHGEDAGSQAYARLTAAVSPFVGWRAPADAGAAALDNRPLEAAVEGEPFTPDLATRVEIGATFLALLGQELAPGLPPPALLAALRARYPVSAAPRARTGSQVLDTAWTAPPVAGGVVTAALVAAFAAAGLTLASTSTGTPAETADTWL